jgi:hypothetical protein
MLGADATCDGRSRILLNKQAEGLIVPFLFLTIYRCKYLTLKENNGVRLARDPSHPIAFLQAKSSYPVPKKRRIVSPVKT